MVNSNWFWDCGYLVNIRKLSADSTMHTKYAVIYESCKWHFLEKFITSLEKGTRVIHIFFKFHLALVTKPHSTINSNILMGATKQKNILRIFELQGK